MNDKKALKIIALIYAGISSIVMIPFVGDMFSIGKVIIFLW